MLGRQKHEMYACGMYGVPYTLHFLDYYNHYYYLPPVIEPERTSCRYTAAFS